MKKIWLSKIFDENFNETFDSKFNKFNNFQI